MKPSEIRALSDKELVEKLDELKSELFNLRFQHAINQLDNPVRIKEVKRDIARTLTVIRAKELESAKAEREAE
ncbi:MAG: 50S ribosomal protein L29 [Oscillospiraceae bacterium]|jgi:large subunit ribosomal protein L29|nr:50S ribosomal protein L29 [Oscillospiraceae bacterium]MBQ5341172.1 50S ribosomal protein L29 [Oscillospiraceae bacterium]MBQ5412480.1 50S ribosomal protein L29 [Oscillospiraceae bacterium]MBR4827854.1 50S ribosomal protein L29 [Oscillospiraceae bacterium]MBR5064656.1 50S ribosomal protein L29 [Oscillospiraceae bacterium]